MPCCAVRTASGGAVHASTPSAIHMNMQRSLAVPLAPTPCPHLHCRRARRCRPSGRTRYCPTGQMAGRLPPGHAARSTTGPRSTCPFGSTSFPQPSRSAGFRRPCLCRPRPQSAGWAGERAQLWRQTSCQRRGLACAHTAQKACTYLPFAASITHLASLPTPAHTFRVVYSPGLCRPRRH